MTAAIDDRWRFCVAPMMDWTDRHCRAFHRLLSSRARLYTEMVTTGAVLHGDRERLLGFGEAEHPVALQLGGSDPDDLARAAEIGAGFGYDEIDLNCGCPSSRVSAGRFGACLMAEPNVVGACVAAMKRAVDVPVTVKCRLGIDDQETGPALDALADAAIGAGADALVVHARKAWLKGLDPKQNRTIPPLDYDRVRELKRRYPHVPIVLNGGLADLGAAEAAMAGLDGVMLGRAAYQSPWQLADVDRRFHGDGRAVERADVALAMVGYAREQVARGVRVASVDPAHDRPLPVLSRRADVAPHPDHRGRARGRRRARDPGRARRRRDRPRHGRVASRRHPSVRSVIVRSRTS